MKPSFSAPFWASAACLLISGGLLLQTGCAGYKLGPTGGVRAGDRSLQINPVANSTPEPRLGPAVSQALRKQIQRDGTFHLNTHGDGDIAVSTEIVRYHRRGIAFNPRDTITAVDYEITMDAKVTATERRSGREILNKEVKARITIRIGQDQTDAERQALPLLADNLAQNIVSLLTDGEW